MLVLVLAIALCGHALSGWLWQGEEECGALERLASIALLGLSVWVGLTWLLYDEWTGPTDVIAVDEAPDDSWIYPAYGRHFTRQVTMLPADGPVIIPPDVRWVLIDRHYSVDRGENVKDAHELLEAYKPGPPRPGDLRVLEAMQQNPDFMLAAANSKAREYLFMRKPR